MANKDSDRRSGDERRQDDRRSGPDRRTKDRGEERRNGDRRELPRGPGGVGERRPEGGDEVPARLEAASGILCARAVEDGVELTRQPGRLRH